jgi:hypothetical protein
MAAKRAILDKLESRLMGRAPVDNTPEGIVNLSGSGTLSRSSRSFPGDLSPL